MWSIFERGKKIIFALMLSIIPLSLMYVQSKDTDVRYVLSWPFIEMVGLIEKSAINVSGSVSDMLYRYFYMTTRLDELRELRAKVLEVESLKTKLDFLNYEHNYILELGFNREPEQANTYELARVIARAGGAMVRMIRIDRGSEHGLSPEDPVIAHGGVVGQVISVSHHFSDVLLLTDASFAIDAMIADSGYRGLLRGKNYKHNYLMEIRDIDGLAKVSKGDRVVTSGLNSSFSRGIPIGVITETFKSNDGLYIRAKIKPFVDIDNLSHVMVAKSLLVKSPWPMAIK